MIRHNEVPRAEEDLLQRQRQDEWMDQPDLDPGLHVQALRGLSNLNRATGIARCLYRQIRRIAKRKPGTLRLLDVASGSGDLPVAWAVRARREGIPLEITTLDVSEFATRMQHEKADAAGVQLRSLQRDCVTEGLPSGFDVCTNSLFLHHLTEEKAIGLVRSMIESAEHVVICDLERSRANRLLVTLGARLVTRSPVVHVDARRSIEGAYSRNEFESLLETACGRDIAVSLVRPCRMLATIHRVDGSERNL